jgi:predicted metal-dependent peptidase
MIRHSEKSYENSYLELLPIAQEEVSRCIVELVRSEPFYGHILGGLQRHFTKEIETLAVGLRGDAIQLMVNPIFFLKGLTKLENRAAVLKHEVLHIVFKHIFRNQALSNHPKLWNIASDLVVNQYVAPYKLPDGAILLSTFPDLGLEENDTADNYYAALAKLHNEGMGKTGIKKRSKNPKSAANLKKILSQNTPSDHSCWANSSGFDIDGERTGANIPQMVRDALRQISEDQIIKAYERTKASKAPGNLPAWLDRHIEDLLNSRKPQINWRNTIRMFAASSRRSKMISTMQRESKRFEAFEGLPHNPGLKLKRFQKLAVAVDTSGSIDDESLSIFFAEINGMYRQGADITVIECDADIRRTYQFQGKVPECVKGGGGTSFEPVMQWLANTRTRYDGCVYLTDGFAGAPETKPPCKLLWVISGGEGGDHLRYGRQIILQA